MYHNKIFLFSKVELNYWMNKNFHLGNGDISSITMTTTSEASLEPVSVGSSFIKDGGLSCIKHTWSKMDNQTTEIFVSLLLLSLLLTLCKIRKKAEFSSITTESIRALTHVFPF